MEENNNAKKTVEKCPSTKRIKELEKTVKQLQKEIEIIKRVIRR